jgi:toxin FitB
MNLVDSSGWLEYFVGGPHADFFAPPIKDSPSLLVPTIVSNL